MAHATLEPARVVGGPAGLDRVVGGLRLHAAGRWPGGRFRYRRSGLAGYRDLGGAVMEVTRQAVEAFGFGRPRTNWVSICATSRIRVVRWMTGRKPRLLQGAR